MGKFKDIVTEQDEINYIEKSRRRNDRVTKAKKARAKRKLNRQLKEDKWQ